MIQKYWKFTLFFILVIVLNLLAYTVIPEFEKVVKVFIMASLLGFYIFHEEQQSELLIIGMIAALMGDIFLMFDHPSFFLIGMLSFLVMQLCYIAVFRKERSVVRAKDWIMPIILLVAGGVILASIYKELVEMRWPVVLYFLAILAMAITAYWRKPSLPGYLAVFIGAVLFIISDAVIAMDRFSTLPWGFTATQVVIMLTYMLAQYLIIVGLVYGRDNAKTDEEESYESKLSFSTYSKEKGRGKKK